MHGRAAARAVSLFLGLYPKPVLDRIEPQVKALIHHIEANSDYKEPGVSTRGPRAKGIPATPRPTGKAAAK